jgi:hypothetical protein
MVGMSESPAGLAKHKPKSSTCCWSGWLKPSTRVGWLIPAGLSSHRSEGWKSEIRHQHGQALVRVLFWVADSHFLTVLSNNGKKSRVFLKVLYKGTIHKGSWPDQLPKTSPPNTVTFLVRISRYELEGTHIAHCTQVQNFCSRTWVLASLITY